MNFVHFVAMLENKGLWFSNLRNFEDPYEGFQLFRSPGFRQHWEDHVKRTGLPEGMTNIEPVLKWNEESIAHAYVNCWHMSEVESAALWKIYGHDGQGIAIQSRYEVFADSLEEKVNLGGVEYVPVEEFDPFNVNRTIMQKRRSFAFESEIRAFYFDVPTPIPSNPVTTSPRLGDWVSIPLDKLVQKVYVCPTAEPWFVDIVKMTVARYGFAFPVEASTLLTPYKS